MESAIQLTVGGASRSLLTIAPFNDENRLEGGQICSRTKHIAQKTQALIVVRNLNQLVFAILDEFDWPKDKEFIETRVFDNIRRVRHNDYLRMLFGSEHPEVV